MGNECKTTVWHIKRVIMNDKALSNKQNTWFDEPLRIY